MTCLVHLSNDSASPWWGWLRANVDKLPAFRGGGHPEANWLLGKQTGLDTHHVDVFTVLQPGERKVIDLDEGQEALRYIPPIVDSPDFLGGIPVTIGGVAMKRIRTVINGAGYDTMYRARVGRMLNVDLHVYWYPDQLEWCWAELIPTASNPAVTDIVAPIEEDLYLRFGDAIVWQPGQLPNAPIRRAGDWFADGQNGMTVVALSWNRHAHDESLGTRVIAFIDQKVQMRGIQRLHHIGNPLLPTGFDGKKWTREMLPEVTRVLTSWEKSPLDPAFVSGATGAQGGQSFVCGPALSDPSCVGPIYLGACDGSWPMFHLEEDGSQLDWKAHHGLRLYYGRVNRGSGMSDETLGKPTEPDLQQTHGYAGPEDEHWFDWIALGAARLKGSAATQWVLRAHAIQFLFRWVVEPPANWLTANRGVGWISFLAAELYRNLEDRELAEAIKTRWIALFDALIQPQMGTADGYWSWRRDDRIGPGIRAIPWQASVMALGLRFCGDVLEHYPAIELATTMAEDIIARAWVQRGGRWTSRDVIALDGSDPGFYGAYDFFGMPMSLDAELLWNPGHGIALAIKNQLIAESQTWQKASWLAPTQAVTP